MPDIIAELPPEHTIILRHGFVWLLAVFSASGGLLSGYAIGLVGVLSSSSTFTRTFPDLQLPDRSTPTFVVVFLLSAAFGSSPAVGGLCAGRFGRKRTIVAGAAIGVLSGVLMAMTPEGDDAWLYLTRALSGISTGITSVSVPLYQSEVAPVQLRGKLMATFQLAVTLGIL